MQVSNTIMARDYKGIGNQDMTAVIIPITGEIDVIGKVNPKRHSSTDIHGVGG